MTQHQDLSYKDDFYFLKRKSVTADSTSDRQIVAATVPGGSEYSMTAPTARHTGAPGGARVWLPEC